MPADPFSVPPPPAEPRTAGLAWKYLGRALRLRCPECGVTPVFPPLRHLRRLGDLFTPRDGCPRCGYAFEREMGYFLMATWAVSYGFGSVVGLSIYLSMEYILNASLTAMLWVCIPAVLVFNLVTARHARSLWLAVDHFFDPHVRAPRGGGGDGGGNVPRRPPPPPVAPAPGGTPAPPERELAGTARRG